MQPAQRTLLWASRRSFAAPATRAAIWLRGAPATCFVSKASGEFACVPPAAAVAAVVAAPVRCFSTESNEAPASVSPQEILQFRDSVRMFAEQEIGPLVDKMEEECNISLDVISALFQQGYMAMGVSSEDGGSGISFLDSLLVVKEMSRVDPAVGLMVTVHNHLVLGALNRFGTNEQKDKFLPSLSSDTVGCFCLGEDNSNSSSSSSSSLFDLKCKATRDAEKGGWIINGKKRYVLNAKESGVFLVVAATPADEAEGQLTCFLVQREGIKVETETAKAGSQASSVSEVSLKGTFVPDSHVLGPVGGAKKICDELLMDSQIGVAAQQLGLAEGALHVAASYLIERRKIDEDAKSSYIKYEIAKAAAEIESVKALVHYAASLRTAAAPAAAAAAAAARYKAAATAAAVSSKCVDLVGPSALSKDLEKYYRDSKSTAYDLCGEEQLLQPIFDALINEYN